MKNTTPSQTLFYVKIKGAINPEKTQPPVFLFNPMATFSLTPKV